MKTKLTCEICKGSILTTNVVVTEGGKHYCGKCYTKRKMSWLE